MAGADPAAHGRKFLRARVVVPVLVILFAIFLLPGASLYYHYSGGRSCTRCHEIWQPYRDWHESAHRDIACSECHGDVLTLDAGFHLKNIRQLAKHLRGQAPEQVRLKTDDVLDIEKRCAKCHREEYASWAAGPHSATYTNIFLDKDHNKQTRLMDDCLRCHSMHFQGSIRDLVTPIDTQGPWKLRDNRLADQPAMPCLTCHQLHRHGTELVHVEKEEKPDDAGPRQEITRPSLALFDRREQDYVPLHDLPLPQMFDGTRAVKISPDQRQALCYQCHAPSAGGQVGTGDDRTPIGVHEGLSCLACHEKHGQTTRASCSTCHPQLSNCGLDVEKMDTTFKSAKSPHNVHTVKCLDCHKNGIPKSKKTNIRERRRHTKNSGLRISLVNLIGRAFPWVLKLRTQDSRLRTLSKIQTARRRTCEPSGGLFGIDQEVVTLRGLFGNSGVPARPASRAESILNHR